MAQPQRIRLLRVREPVFISFIAQRPYRGAILLSRFIVRRRSGPGHSGLSIAAAIMASRSISALEPWALSLVQLFPRQSVNAGNGWWRITFIKNEPTGASTPVSAPAPGDATCGASYTGDGTSGILVWGCQVEAGSFAMFLHPDHIGSGDARRRCRGDERARTSRDWYNPSRRHVRVGNGQTGKSSPDSAYHYVRYKRAPHPQWNA